MDATHADLATALPRGHGDIATEISRLIPSSEPAVVFASLAQLCVPVFSDRCSVDIVEDGRTCYRISSPPGDDIAASPPPDDPWTVRTRFESAGMSGNHKYTGVVTHTWRTRKPTAADAAQAEALVCHAVTVIYGERIVPDVRE